jgi:DNA-binding NtrC family response regulator
MLCRLSCDILRREGYRAVPAYNAVEALEAFQQHTFDVVVTDFSMQGMNGLQLAQEIHKRSPKLPILVVSAYDSLESEYVRMWIPKETLFPTLLEEIRLCLAEFDAARESAEKSDS